MWIAGGTWYLARWIAVHDKNEDWNHWPRTSLSYPSLDTIRPRYIFPVKAKSNDDRNKNINNENTGNRYNAFFTRALNRAGSTMCLWFTTNKSTRSSRMPTSIIRWHNTWRICSSGTRCRCLTRKCIRTIRSRWITLKYDEAKSFFL